jgi:hypothetical protein
MALRAGEGVDAYRWRCEAWLERVVKHTDAAVAE